MGAGSGAAGRGSGGELQAISAQPALPSNQRPLLGSRRNAIGRRPSGRGLAGVGVAGRSPDVGGVCGSPAPSGSAPAPRPGLPRRSRDRGRFCPAHRGGGGGRVSSLPVPEGRSSNGRRTAAASRRCCRHPALTRKWSHVTWTEDHVTWRKGHLTRARPSASPLTPGDPGWPWGIMGESAPCIGRRGAPPPSSAAPTDQSRAWPGWAGRCWRGRGLTASYGDGSCPAPPTSSPAYSGTGQWGEARCWRCRPQPMGSRSARRTGRCCCSPCRPCCPTALWGQRGGGHLLYPHLGPTAALSFCPTETQLATGGRDRAVAVWGASGAAMGQQLRRWENAHKEWVCAVGWAGGLLLSGSADGTLLLWDVAVGQRLRELVGLQGPPCAVGGHGRWLLAVGRYGSLCVSMGRYGSLWVSMCFYGSLWGTAGPLAAGRGALWVAVGLESLRPPPKPPSLPSWLPHIGLHRPPRGAESRGGGEWERREHRGLAPDRGRCPPSCGVALGAMCGAGGQRGGRRSASAGGGTSGYGRV
ncbi:uncharacterized protein LOC125687748, partial [Lagopus muta]|uniref:uncharacterized protein LOC125687748 n=1 Tax=Lagopus muta TaxID=64668 RepID=UPI00209E30F6